MYILQPLLLRFHDMIVALFLLHKFFQQATAYCVIDAAFVSQTYKVMKAFGIKPFQHIINSLVGEGGKHDTLALLA